MAARVADGSGSSEALYDLGAAGSLFISASLETPVVEAAIVGDSRAMRDEKRA